MTSVALSVAVPAATSGTDLARSWCERARNNSTPPVIVANAMPSKRWPPPKYDPAAAPTAPSAAAAENATTRLVSQLLARIALALRRCVADAGSPLAGSGSDLEDNPASIIDIGAEASTKTSDIAADAAPIVCSGAAVTAPTTAAAASTAETCQSREHGCAATYHAHG